MFPCCSTAVYTHTHNLCVCQPGAFESPILEPPQVFWLRFPGVAVVYTLPLAHLSVRCAPRPVPPVQCCGVMLCNCSYLRRATCICATWLILQALNPAHTHVLFWGEGEGQGEGGCMQRWCSECNHNFRSRIVFSGYGIHGTNFL